jgi:hypothetical protein
VLEKSRLRIFPNGKGRKRRVGRPCRSIEAHAGSGGAVPLSAWAIL